MTKRIFKKRKPITLWPVVPFQIVSQPLNTLVLNWIQLCSNQRSHFRCLIDLVIEIEILVLTWLPCIWNYFQSWTHSEFSSWSSILIIPVLMEIGYIYTVLLWSIKFGMVKPVSVLMSIGCLLFGSNCGSGTNRDIVCVLHNCISWSTFTAQRKLECSLFHSK